LVFVTCLIFRTEISGRFSESSWQPGNLYNAVFGWSSIQSGFVFAAYGFIVTKRDGFAGILVGGQTYERFLQFTRRACFGGFFLAVISLPFVVVVPSIKPDQPLAYYVIVSWFSYFVWTFSAFLRVAFTFGKIMATPDKPKHIPG
jgi:hypothetical protein